MTYHRITVSAGSALWVWDDFKHERSAHVVRSPSRQPLCGQLVRPLMVASSVVLEDGVLCARCASVALARGWITSVAWVPSKPVVKHIDTIPPLAEN
jgi:hypothetical protein